MTIKAIILDFDGVIVESEEIKNRAFRDLFSDYPEHLDEIMAYHLGHKAVSRYDKFEYIVTRILGQAYSEERAREIDARFSPLLRQRIIECPYVEGAEAFLEYFSSRLPLYVASATPQNELEAIIAGRRIGGYFKGIYGTPLEKEAIIREIVAGEKLMAQEAAYIGDTRADCEVARKVGAVFVGRMGADVFRGLSVPAFRDLHGVRGHLQGMIGDL